MTLRSPTLFSGCWNAEAANEQSFSDGGFHMGDLFVRHADASLDFVDRLKVLIKSGGKNICPAEIERVLQAHPAVADSAVVRKADADWGEWPVAFAALPRSSTGKIQRHEIEQRML
jgi:acyl-CoA synthetase (AMP-forming)/AMP-acid ligase II